MRHIQMNPQHSSDEIAHPLNRSASHVAHLVRW
uniref:Uncharacterized protein n=1 Tax=Arundo donax TaxID=35708 RepID=A0A0A8YKW5_ARUDO